MELVPVTNGLPYDRSAAWTGLLDDAAIFPPGGTAIDRAVLEHHAHRAAWYSDLVGPFVATEAHWPQIVPHLRPGTTLPISLIASAHRLGPAVAAVLAEPAAHLVAVEVTLPATTPAALLADLDRAGVPDGVHVAVEVPVDLDAALLDALAGTGHRVKLRTGGMRADAFPAPRALATTVLACHARGLAFKATAGLHHAVRHDDPATGFAHHGFLNLLLASAAARDGADADDLVAVLSNADRMDVARQAAHLDTRTRELFTSFGTCSIDDPVADLVQFGLLTTPRTEMIDR